MKMKRILPLLLVLALALSACTAAPKAPDKDEVSDKVEALSPEDWAAAYTAAIRSARDDEMNEYFPVTTQVTGFSDDVEEEMTLTMLGFPKEDAECYAISMSLMNVSAYAIVAVLPVEGKEETVKTGLENYIDAQKGSFEHYLEDQYEIAASAKLEKLDDGTLLLVMCEGQDEVFRTIKTAVTQDK